MKKTSSRTQPKPRASKGLQLPAEKPKEIKSRKRLDRVFVMDLGAKIEVLLYLTGMTDKQLRSRLGLNPDYYSRIKNGSRLATPVVFRRLQKSLDPESRITTWNQDLETFGRELGISRRQIGYICHRPVPGIDFTPRIKDPEHVQRLVKVLQGFWEVRYFAASSLNLQVECKLLKITGLNDDSFIECVIFGSGGTEHYRGSCFPTNSHLYVMLEDVRLFSELVFGIFNLPDRTPPAVLKGVVMGLSGGVDELGSSFIPCAVRAIWRQITTASQAEQLGGGLDAVEERLKQEIPRRLNPAEINDEEGLSLLAQISNFVPLNTRPFALRMDGVKRAFLEPDTTGQQLPAEKVP
jgi:hypothetical protein